MEIITDFKFKDERCYVHSTSLMEGLWNNVFPQLDMDPCDFLVDAKFHKLINSNGYFLIEKGNNIANIEQYSASFKIFNQSSLRYIYFKDEGIKILDTEISNITILNYQTNNKFSGKAIIKAYSLKEFIGNIVDLNKKIHLDSVIKKKVKVINLYMKNIPALKEYNKNYIEIDIENVSIRNSDIGLVTLNKVNFKDFAAAPMFISYVMQS